MYKFVQGCWFLFRVFCLFAWETTCYSILGDSTRLIRNITRGLSKMNLLYVKIFQAFALNHQMISEELNQELMNFTDQAPWGFEDVPLESLANLAINHHIYLVDGFYHPINAGMISLVYKTYWKEMKKDIVIKVKRRDIEVRLQSAIEQLLFFMQFLSFFPFFHHYQLEDLIQRNIDMIQHQIHFQEEVDHMIRIKENCKALPYVKIPEVYPEFTQQDSNLIVMDFMEGMKINDILEEDYEPFAKQVLKFGFVTTLLHGFTHGDLHAGNILFIKNSEPDGKTTYQLGILDFGIMFPIHESFKHTLLEITADLFTDPPDQIAKRFLHSELIIQPLKTIENLDQEHYQYLLDIMTFSLNETIHRNKDGNQIRLYDFIYNLHSYLKVHSLHSLGLSLSDDFVKTQLVLAMAHGITMKLCKENYIGLADRVINELFHIDLLDSE
jgi:predicted unusual protein kinase regulating ubiquinone biosynthesis (AarF/ABC1/UbiB family)